MEFLNLLCSKNRLERDQGVSQLQQHLTTTDDSFLREMLDIIKNELEKTDQNYNSEWEDTFGFLLAIKILAPFLVKYKILDEEHVLSFILKALQENLSHNEMRVRIACGEVLGSFCEHIGPSIYEEVKDTILQLIEDNLERNDINPGTMSPEELKQYDNLKRNLEEAPRIKTKEEIFHDTAGWKYLESSIKCLQAMVDGCGNNFTPFVTQKLLDLLFRALIHTNRFVRETGFYVLGSLVASGFNEQGLTNPNSPFGAEQFGHQVSQALSIGLSDNWSQVRLASSEATRKFLLSFQNESERDVYYEMLLPRICLNRYYVADGVRIYSQETWRQITNTEGRELVQKYISSVVKYYLEQTKANNHAVREAACACIAELGSKINRDSLQPHVYELLDTLLECFKDDSWPVRDAACLATGHFIICFPEESKTRLKSLMPMFFENLYDNIPSVRQGAAGALRNVVKAYEKEVLDEIELKIKEGFQGIFTQEEEDEKYSQFCKEPALFSVAKMMRANDPTLHTDQVMYSCGSLAPKMGRGGGCSSATHFRKPPQPWEKADGCLYLMSELSQLPISSPNMVKYLDDLALAANFKAYPQYLSFLETLCKMLPNIARGIGKKTFKNYLESFLDNIFYSLLSENALASSAASQCLTSLANILGPSILRSRVEMHNPSYLEKLEATINISAF